MSDGPWSWNDDRAGADHDPRGEMGRVRARAARQRVEGLILQLSPRLDTHPDQLRYQVEAELGMPIWEASTDQLLGWAAALYGVHRTLHGTG